MITPRNSINTKVYKEQARTRRFGYIEETQDIDDVESAGCPYEDQIKFYNDIAKLCDDNAYNIFLHKHLGDVFYIIAAHKLFEQKYRAPLRFIVRPQHAFLMKLYNIENYSVYDSEWFERLVQKSFFPYFSRAAFGSFPFDILCMDLFQSVPIKKRPFVAGSSMVFFFLFRHYWADQWKEQLGLAQDSKYILPPHQTPLSEQAKEILQKIAPLDKIVLFAPEASTALEWDPEFWEIIAEAAAGRGYTIIVNSKNYKIKHGISAYDLNLSLSDVVALGFQCAYVFALRSGLCDVLAAAGNKLYAFYPSCFRREMHSLSRVFTSNPHVHEIGIWDWKIDRVIWEDIDLTAALQTYIDNLRCLYRRERIKKKFSPKKTRSDHKSLCLLLDNLAGFPTNAYENNRENPQPSRSVRIRIFGVPIYEKYESRRDSIRKRNYIVFGLFHYAVMPGRLQVLRILGVSVLSRKRWRYETVKLLGIPLYKKKRTKGFLKALLKKIPPGYDDIYLIRHNLGEGYIYLSHLESWVRANRSKNPLLIVWRKKDIPFYEMFLSPKVGLKYLGLDAGDIFSILDEGEIRLKEHRLFCPTPDIAHNMKKELALDKDIHFYKFITNDFKTAENLPMRKPLLSKDSLQNADTKVKLYLKEPFVILCPQATSLDLLPHDFWINIVSRFQKKGYDVFINKHNDTTNFKTAAAAFDSISAVSFEVNIAELYALSLKAAGIITLASGMATLLSAAGRPMDLIYTDLFYRMGKNPKALHCLPSSLCLQFYSVFNIPGINREVTREYDKANYTEENLTEAILSNYRDCVSK